MIEERHPQSRCTSRPSISAERASCRSSGAATSTRRATTRGDPLEPDDMTRLWQTVPRVMGNPYG